MDHGAPLIPVAHHGQFAGFPGAVGHAVDGEIEAHAGRDAVHGGLAQRDHAELAVRQGQGALFRLLVGAGVGSQGVGGAGFVRGGSVMWLKTVNAA